jgi:3-hydroxyacyl-[acyl-carrier-protein] dehydratase
MGTSDSILTGEFFFDPEDFIYTDHFPGNPVVPGSLIIDAFIRVVQPVGEDQGRRWSVENFRFRNFISPGRYAFRVAGKSHGVLQCALYDGGRTVATGVLSDAGSMPESRG